MLEIEWNHPSAQPRRQDYFTSGRQQQANMPVDFTAYLLSSSPPGFEFFQLRDQFASAGGHVQNGRSSVPFSALKPVVAAPAVGSSRRAPPAFFPNDEGDFSLDRTTEDDDIFYCNGDISPTSPTSPRTRGMGKKKVSFADEVGLNLTEIRIMAERSDSPPLFRSELIDSLTQGATAGVTETPPLKLNFSQPASDYLVFREKLDRDMVSLENVILKDYNLMGTIKVKNIAFEKNVFVRVTFDNWAHTNDIYCTYVPSTGGPSSYDTFSFELSVPPTMQRQHKTEFCVCYEANGRQYWDNNKGSNYEALSTDWTEPTDKTTFKSPVFVLCDDVDWTSYSSMNYIGNIDEPYY